MRIGLNCNLYGRPMGAVWALVAVMLSCASAAGAELTFTGSRVVSVNADASTGLERIYVVEDLSGVTVSYPAADAKWSVWGSMGAADAEPVSVTTDSSGSHYRFPDANDFGITVEEAGRMHHYWVVDHALHRADFSGLSVDGEESDCQSMYLSVEPLIAGKNYGISYYTINGAPRTLDRGYTLSYNTLEYDENANTYNFVRKEDNLDALKQSMRVEKPLCDTQFALSGDRFDEAWGNGNHAESAVYVTDAVEAMTYAEKEERDNDNEQNDGTSGLGGSAPVDITFTAVVTDAVKFTEWQLSSSPDFDSYELRFNQTEVSYTFTEYGTWYMRFQASNADGSCDYISPTYEIQIGESRLVCPNAFSPGASEGVNDEWKVSYKSIVDFECHIFNRWGVKVATLTHPSQGWDGKYNGKLVPSGVYYYVIKARGADGHKYDMSGDINIIRYNQSRGGSVTNE